MFLIRYIFKQELIIYIHNIQQSCMGKKGKGKKQVHDDQEKQQEEVAQRKQSEQQPPKENEPEEKPKAEIVQPKKVQYCPICTFPFQLCKYGKKAADCKKFLIQIAPTKVSKYHPDVNAGDQQKGQDNKQKQEEVKQVKQPKQPKKQKSVRQKYILIDVKPREKKKYTSDVSGLSIFKIQTKDLAKKLSKKFACSCAAIDEDKMQVQGDFFEQIKQILINEYNVKKKYILDKTEFKQKAEQQKEKKKAQKKLASNVIPEQPEAENKPEVPEQPKKIKSTQAQQMLADVSDDEQKKQETVQQVKGKQ